MIEKSPLDPATIKSWMHNAGVDHYLCGQCHGLHLSELQGLEGVVESRLLVEEWGLLISTEYLIRPTALLPIAADLGHLNANYPILKLFPDVVDDAMPQLIAGATFLTGAGMTEAQFAISPPVSAWHRSWRERRWCRKWPGTSPPDNSPDDP